MLDSTGFLDSILDHVPLALVIKDPSRDYAYIFWNKAAEKIWGVKREEILGKTDFDISPPETAFYFRESDLRCLATGESVYLDKVQIPDKDGKNHWLRVWKTCFQTPDGRQLILGVGQDVTDLMEVEKSKVHIEHLLSFEREKLAHAARLATLGEMAGGVAHEINTPLGVISLHCEVALAQLEESPPNPVLEKHLTKIQDTVFQIASIVQTMRTLSKREVQGNCEWVGLREMLGDLGLLIGHRLKQEDVEFNCDEVTKELQLYCKSVQLNQVFLNLISNSIDALDGEKKWIKVSVHENEKSLESVEIHFTDSGAGIKSDVQNHMFETFFTTKDAQKGTGLGLGISREIIRSYGGDLRFDSGAPNTTFVIVWPRDRYGAISARV